MTLHDIIEKCSMLDINEKRCVSDEYGELVIHSKDLSQWYQIFADTLGPAEKVEGTKPTKDDLNLTKPYGGICDNQTLFKKEYDDVVVIAMFWPWQDGVCTTLKIAFQAKR